MRSQMEQELARERARLWVEELYREYGNILFQYSMKLRQPVIRIDDVASVWGSWHALTRTIVISQRLIEKHSWDIVIEVLKHEMAHQLVSEVYGGDHHHDALFLRACQRLGVADWAARAAGDLPESIPCWRDRALSLDQERLLKRAEKLLALANSTNEHEALLAMQRVRELYVSHRLERLRERRGAELVHLLVGRRRRRVEAHESMILSILAEHFYVRVIHARLYDATECVHHQVAELVGTHENVLMAEYVYHYLWQQVHSLWESHREASGKSVAAKRSYMLGVLAGFREKLARQARTEAVAATDPRDEDQALVAVENRAVDEYLKRRHPRLTKKSWGGGRIDRGSYQSGVADGERLTLRKGVGGAAERRGLLLGS